MRALFRVIPVLLVLGPVLGLVFGAAAALAAPLALKVDAALASFDSTGAAVVNARLEPESGAPSPNSPRRTSAGGSNSGSTARRSRRR